MKILEIINLSKSFKDKFTLTKVLDGVDLDINEGNIFGFLGLNGSGKTTTLKCILGFLRPDKGEINIFENKFKSDVELFQKIGYAPESAYFYDHLTGLEFLVFLGELSKLTKQEAELRSLELLEKVGLEFAKKKLIKSYSKGMKQRLGLAASLINDPELLFWDEPMSGLDPLGRSLVKDLMIQLKQSGKTIFFNTHILSDVQDVSDNFAILHGGKIITNQTTASLQKPLDEYFKEVIKQNDSDIKLKG